MNPTAAQPEESGLSLAEGLKQVLAELFDSASLLTTPQATGKKKRGSS